MSTRTGRIWEIDFLRGLALLFMIYFHIVYDLKELFHYPVVYESGLNYLIGKASGTIFIFVAGISSTLTKSNGRRACRILALALLISLVTHLYDQNMGVKFGILHFLGVSILTAPLLQRINKVVLLALGAGVLGVAPYLTSLSVDHNYLFPLGLTTGTFISSDFYPLLPWYGVFIFGFAAGLVLYKNRASILPIQGDGGIISKVGRRTLLVYILHQPVIIAILSLYYGEWGAGL